MPLPPGLAAPPPPMPTRPWSWSALQPARPAEPGPSPTVPTRRYSEPATVPPGARTRERRSLPCAYSSFSEARPFTVVLPPTRALAGRGEALPTSRQPGCLHHKGQARVAPPPVD
ncbi:hypothetical protein F4775DRAFT_596331 [Biscogniauxia sp. FL1348]|nr:hypothetical protein F4775DRAFT_596331 [Biscogniauxia sp. FL1348]